MGLGQGACLRELCGAGRALVSGQLPLSHPAQSP